MRGKTESQVVTFWVGNEPNPEDRRKIAVSPKDAAKIGEFHGELGASASVTDVLTGEKLVVEQISCGLPNCNCALGIRK